MPLIFSVVPGWVFTDGELVVTATLNALGNPVFTATGTVGGSEIAAGGVNVTHVAPGAYFAAVATGSSNAYAVTLNPSPSALVDGLWFSFRANHSNTGAVTVNVNGLGAKALVMPDREALRGGEITNGQEVWVQYDGSQFQMVSPKSIPSAVYAADAGTANAYAITLPGVTVSALSQLTGIQISFKAAAANTGASTLTVNGLTATAITKKGTTALSANDILAGQVVTVVYDGTRFQLVGSMDAPALPDLGVAGETVYPFRIVLDSQGRVTGVEGGVSSKTEAIPSAGSSTTWTHGLSRIPAFVRAVLLMGATTEHGYAAGDEVDLQAAYIDEGTNDFAAFAVVSNATSVTVSRYNANIYIPHKTTGSNSLVTTANWQLKMYAF